MADACRSHSLKWRWVPNLGIDKIAIVVFGPKNAPVTANVPVIITGVTGSLLFKILTVYLESPSVAQANGMPTLQSFISTLEGELVN